LIAYNSIGRKKIRQFKKNVAGHYRADVTARDTTAPTVPRGDTTASDFTARDITARYIYSARHYRD
jgi:ABC-type microcin C transport system permease subunit YejE